MDLRLAAACKLSFQSAEAHPEPVGSALWGLALGPPVAIADALKQDIPVATGWFPGHRVNLPRDRFNARQLTVFQLIASCKAAEQSFLLCRLHDNGVPAKIEAATMQPFQPLRTALQVVRAFRPSLSLTQAALVTSDVGSLCNHMPSRFGLSHS